LTPALSELHTLTHRAHRSEEVEEEVQTQPELGLEGMDVQLYMSVTSGSLLIIFIPGPDPSLSIPRPEPTYPCACTNGDRLALFVQDQPAFYQQLECYKQDLLGDKGEHSFWWYAGVAKKGLSYTTGGANRALYLPCMHGTRTNCPFSLPRFFAATHLRPHEYWKMAGMFSQNVQEEKLI
jgi:hypothetical protein